ncbi:MULTISPECIES: hypothetical protein [Burkholderia]|uniref:hypothetical protein n=1 Tax=Burkholderia TaxID=32008 RepID=UPI001F08DBE9|nr:MULTISPECIES: hypothetical protein [Burkholderia]
MRRQFRTANSVERSQELIGTKRMRQLDDIVGLMYHGAPRTLYSCPSATESSCSVETNQFSGFAVFLTV